MSTYRYISTNILTGRVLADSLPLVVRAATRAINGIGRLDGYLELSSLPSPSSAGFMRALIPGQAMLWVLQDGFPVWVGVVLDSPHQSVNSHQYPITAYTPEMIFQARAISTAMTFTNVDIFSIMQALFAYGVNAARGPNAQIANLVLGASTAGVTDSWTFGVSNSLQVGSSLYSGTYADDQPVLDAATTLAAADNIEFTFEPVLSGTTLTIELRLGYPALGQYQSPTQTLNFPGNVIDYARPVARSQGANFLLGTSAANGTGQTYASQPPHGVDYTDLNAGYMLQQLAITWPGSGTTSQNQINSYVDTLLGKYTAGTMTPTPIIGGNSAPLLRQIGLGDAVNFAATSDLDPAGANGTPGLQITARMTGWSLQPPAEQQPEQITLTLGALVGSTGLGGIGVP